MMNISMPIDRESASPTAAGSRASARPRTVFMYSGQGSQYYGMGRELYARNDAFRSAMDDCNVIYRGMVGRDMIAELYDGVDWVLVEGFKASDLPKIEVWRAAAGKPVR